MATTTVWPQLRTDALVATLARAMLRINGKTQVHGCELGFFSQEATPGFEPGMSDLQSDALAAWPRRRWLPAVFDDTDHFTLKKNGPARFGQVI